MKGVIKLGVLLAVFGLTGCEDKVQEGFIKSCKASGGSATVCQCTWNKVSEKYTKEDLAKIATQPGYLPKGFKQNTLEAAVMCKI